jgi:porin
LGARVKFAPIEEVYIQAAVYDGSPDLSSSYFRVNPNFDFSSLGYFELGYRLNQKKEDKGLPGNYKLGAYLHTGEFADNRDVLLGPDFLGAFALTTGTKTHSPNYGVYFLVDQMLYFEQGKEDPAQQGLAGFFRIAGAPPDQNLTQFEIDGGVVYRGPIPGRDYDSIGLAASYLEMSDDLSDAVREVNRLVTPFGFPKTPVPDYEAVVELSYRAQLTAWWTLQGSLQRVIHPSGKTLGDIDDAWAAVLLTTVRF